MLQKRIKQLGEQKNTRMGPSGPAPRAPPVSPNFLYCEISIRKPPEMSSGVGEFAIFPSTHTESDTDNTKTYSPSKGFLRTLPSPTKAAFMRRTRVLVLGMRWMKRSSF